MRPNGMEAPSGPPSASRDNIRVCRLSSINVVTSDLRATVTLATPSGVKGRDSSAERKTKDGRRSAGAKIPSDLAAEFERQRPSYLRAD